MKLGILSDIHAQAGALRRVLDDMPSVDRLVCAGDAVSEYRFCPETVALLLEVQAQCIQGNHEMVLFGGANPHYLEKCRSTFPSHLLDALADAPAELTFEAAGTSVHVVHTSPWPSVDGYVMPQSPLLDRFAELPYDVVILGHSHVPMVHDAGGVMVINPGSCSQPRDDDPRGSYAVLDLDRRQATIHRVALD